jgi:peptidylprolyl isomerase
VKTQKQYRENMMAHLYKVLHSICIVILCSTLNYGEKNMTTEKEKITTTESGLKYIDIQEGTGPCPVAGKVVVVHYVGTLENGTKFDSSVDRGQPFRFPIGQGVVIKGWDEGVMSMKVGGERQLIIPSNLGYGSREIPGVIPANSTLIFNVKLIAIE